MEAVRPAPAPAPPPAAAAAQWSVEDLPEAPSAPLPAAGAAALRQSPVQADVRHLLSDVSDAPSAPPAAAAPPAASAPPAYEEHVRRLSMEEARPWAPPPALYPAVPAAPVAPVAPVAPAAAPAMAPPPVADVIVPGRAVAAPEPVPDPEPRERPSDNFERALSGAAQVAEAVASALWGRGVAGADAPAEDNRRQRERWVVHIGDDGMYVAEVQAPHRRGTVSLGRFRTEVQARRACEELAPPRWVPDELSPFCACCREEFALLRRHHHCRNCGKVVCGPCSRQRWPATMVPPLFNSKKESRVRVCRFCHDAMEGFRGALLRGDTAAARTIYDRGNVNLACPYTIYRDHSYPVHCAAQGGSLAILEWLVDDRRCTLWTPAPSDGLRPLTNAAGESVLAVAARCLQRHVVRWLVQTKGSRAHEVASKDVLHEFLQDYIVHDVRRHRAGIAAPAGDPPAADDLAAAGAAAHVDAAEQSPCIVCFEREVDCVLVPCGHVGVCSGCAGQLEECPVCRAGIERVLRTFRVC